jgi:hypothetical protein
LVDKFTGTLYHLNPNYKASSTLKRVKLTTFIRAMVRFTLLRRGLPGIDERRMVPDFFVGQFSALLTLLTLSIAVLALALFFFGLLLGGGTCGLAKFHTQ